MEFVAPLLQEYVAAPDKAVKVAEPPRHNAEFVEVIVSVGAG